MIWSIDGQSKEQNDYSPFIEILETIKRDYKQELSYTEILKIFTNDINANFNLGLKIERPNNDELIIEGLTKKKLKITESKIEIKSIFQLCDNLRPLIEKILTNNKLEINYVEFISDYLISSIDSDSWLTSQAEYDKYLASGTHLGISYKRDSLGAYEITSVKKNSAADLVGIKIGDRVTEIHDVPTKYLGAGNFLKMSSGQEGVSFTVKIERNGTPIKHTIVLNDFKHEGSDDKISLLSESTLYVKLNHISEGIANKINGALTANNLITKVIIDLQDCPGGLFNEAIELVNLFVDRDKTITSITYRNKFYNSTYRGTNPKPFKDCKVIILTNQETASGGEIIAAAFQDNKRGQVIGTKTGGIGNLQRYFNFQSSTIYRGKITTGEILTPSGKSIAKNGVTPDIHLNEMTDLLKYAIESVD